MEPLDASAPASRADGAAAGAGPRAGRGGVVWGAVLAGAGVGLVVMIVVATTRAVLDRRISDFDQAASTRPLRILLVVMLVGGYFAAGWVAQRRAAVAGVADAPFTHGMLAGIGAVVAWIPLRFLIWVARDEHRALVRGADAALRPGQVFGALVIAAGLGLLGGSVAARTRRARASGPRVEE